MAKRLCFFVISICIVAVTVVFLGSSTAIPQAEAAPEQRQPWKTSAIIGTPEPPPPYRPQRLFEKLQFAKPVHLELNRTQNRWYVLEQDGKILTFANDPQTATADVALDCARDLTSWKPEGNIEKLDAVYGLTFHPKFAENRYCYICYVLKPKKGDLPEGSRVSRFTVSDTNPPKIDPASEQLLFTFLAGGHNGGCLAFGPDGHLYISTGDAANPNPPDSKNTGQDCSDLLSSMLRIDVDHPAAGKNYGIPKDNPFVGRAGIRPEVYAFGFRNPWKFSFDRQTGALWVGDVGWEMWEMIYRVVSGGNYGWPIKEGPQSVRPDVNIGPTPILPPAIAFPHTEAASITGGFVYRGKRFKDLAGAYICADWMSRKFWATTFTDDKIATHREIAVSQHQIISFAEDETGELCYLDYSPNGGIYTLVPNEEASKPQPPFPTKLSETGIWADVKSEQPANGVYPYTLNAEPWADHATMSRVVALPGDSAATIYHHQQKVPGTAWFNAKVFFPKHGVLAKTFAIEMKPGDPASKRRIETQIMHFDGQEWRGYTYKWNDTQTDATLVPARGEDIELVVQEPTGPRRQTWHFSSRSECRQCHNPWAGEVLSFTEPQLRSPAHAATNPSWDRLLALGVIKRGPEKLKPGEVDAVNYLVNPHSPSADLTKRAKSYLHVNCAHCHQFGAGGSVDMELKFDQDVESMKVLEAKPVQGTFDIPGCQIIAPGDPYRSVLYYRMAKQGRGRMPHIGSELVDDQGLKLIRQWISQLPARQVDRKLLLACTKPDDSPERRQAIEQLLSSPANALLLADAWQEQQLPASTKASILTIVATKEAPIRDLFERYVPDAQKVKRLGTVIRVEALLAMKGDPQRGKEVFMNKAITQCAQCHKVGQQGGEIGPDLSQIGKKYQKRALLESIIDPSKDIDAKFASYTAETDAGRLVTGLLVKQTPETVTLRDPQGKDITIPMKNVSSLTPSKKSLMPEQLLRDLTAEQAADLLAYLESLK